MYCALLHLYIAMPDDMELISTAGQRTNIVYVLQKNGVINWRRRNMIADGDYKLKLIMHVHM